MQAAVPYLNSSATHWRCPPPPPDIQDFHGQLPDSSPTALMELPGIGEQLGVRRLFVKDESRRLGLPAFKALGVSYAIYRVVSERSGEGSLPRPSTRYVTASPRRTPSSWSPQQTAITVVRWPKWLG